MPSSGQLKMGPGGFPGGAVVESPPADAGDTGSCPGPGRSHMPRSGWARAPWPLSLRVQSLCSAMGEGTTVRGPRTAKKKKKNGRKMFYKTIDVKVPEKSSKSYLYMSPAASYLPGAEPSALRIKCKPLTWPRDCA